MTQTTLKSIAQLSGFSVTTVSRALAGYNDVNEKTRQHILQIADELGYQPNLVARQLRSQRTHTIGMIIPADMQYVEDEFFTMLTRSVVEKAAEYKYDLLTSAQVTGANEMDAYRRIVGGHRVDGMILARTHQNDPRIDYLKSVKHPFVVSGRLAPDQISDFPYIDTDSEMGLKMMVDHMVAHNHEHIGLILPPEDIAYTPYRLNGYCQGLDAHALPYRSEYTIYSNLRQDGGYQAAEMLLARNPQLTAIIACNDLMAMGAMNAIADRGMVVGRDVAVIGFDDILPAEHTSPSLTTIRQPIFEIGHRLVDMLVRIIEGASPEESQILLKPKLIIRDSCGTKTP